MATESPIRILEGPDRWSSLKQSNGYEPSSAEIAIESLGLFLREHRFQILGKNVPPSRSGSAPPNLEGSIAAIENIYYHRKSALAAGSMYPTISAINLENELKLHGDSSSSSYHGNTGSGKMTHADGSLRLPVNSLPAHEEESEDDQSFEQSASMSVERADFLGYDSRSLDSTQEDSNNISSPSYERNRSLNCKYVEDVSDTNSRVPPNISISVSSACSNTPSTRDVRKISSPDGTKGRVVGPHLQEKDFNAVDTANTHGVTSVNTSSASNPVMHKFHKKEQRIPQSNVLHQQAAPQEFHNSQVQGSYSHAIYPGISRAYGSLNQFHYGSSSVSTADVQPILQSSGFTPPQYATFMTSSVPYYPNLSPTGFFPPQYSMGGYTLNTPVLPSYLAGYPHQGVVPMPLNGASFPTSGFPNGGSVHAYDYDNLLKFYGQHGIPLQYPGHMQYFQPPLRDPYGSYSHLVNQTPRGGGAVNQVSSSDPTKREELVGFSNNYTTQHLAGPGYNNLNLKRENVSSHRYAESPTNAGPLVQSKPAQGTNFSGGRYIMSLSSGGKPGRINGQSESWNDTNSHSFLEELKSGKGQNFELSDIVERIVELSVDQHGSRFIQQKLETCSAEDKASVFKEVVPHSSRLITDVFGNYVVQKLFEYGSPEQRKLLANQLKGQILPLSLQMYGCRVIQKALEVIDLEQKARLVRELDGHVLRCVRDQNGNHVIQKCIESIPVDNIHFIVSSFRGQVATLSMHPYGCRVIQRLLEHCNDNTHTQFIVDEILNSVCSLAQDQYGNYVTQHVLARGKPLERSEVIEKLGGSIVQLSQHKFASNVVEKLLEYSDSAARGVLIKEIIGNGDKNDNLLVMMKDQYANYVIQKILEKSSGDQRQVLLSLIRNHLAALKKYTYGKHIATRFEQLIGDVPGYDCSSPKI